jgi:hypothetical protein
MTDPAKRSGDERARSEMVARWERNDDDSTSEPGMDMTFTRMP